jgi:hypothetical protein
VWKHQIIPRDTRIKAVVTRACETWVMKKQTDEKLLIFERKIMLKIFSPNKQADGSWRIKTNE